MKSMSKTKLPSECSTGTRRTTSMPWTQCGWPPTTRSAPAPTSARPTSRCTGSGTWVYCVPQCGSTTTTSAWRAVRRTARSTRSRSARTSGPVRGGIRTDSAPGVPSAARGVSPMALKPRKPNRRPPRSTIAGRAAAARSRPAPNGLTRLRRSAPTVSSSASSPKSPAWLLASESASNPAWCRRPTSAGLPPNESLPWVGAPRVDRVLSRLPTVRSARRSREAIGASASAGSVTPRASITSPTTVSSTAPRRLLTGSTPSTRAATTVGPTAASGTTARVPASRSTAATARRAGRPATTRIPRHRLTRPDVSRRNCAVVRSSCGRVA